MVLRGDVTGLLVAWSEGNRAAQSELMDIVYGELKGLAKAYLRRERVGHSFAATALVHEAYLKLVDQRQVQWRSRHHFFGIAAQAMRRILVDRARAGLAAKRGGGALRIELFEQDFTREPPDVEVLALDEALSRLEAIEPRWSRLVELRVLRRLVDRGDRRRDGAVSRDSQARLEPGPRVVVPRADGPDELTPACERRRHGGPRPPGSKKT